MKVSTSFAFASALLMIVSCRELKKNVEEQTTFKGKGVFLYHMPISGSNVELMFIPAEAVQLGETLEVRYPAIGVSLFLQVGDSLFQVIHKAAKKYQLQTHPEMNPIFKVIRATKANVEMEIGENETWHTIQENFLIQNLKLVKGENLQIRYMFADAEIKALQIIN